MDSDLKDALKSYANEFKDMRPDGMWSGKKAYKFCSTHGVTIELLVDWLAKQNQIIDLFGYYVSKEQERINQYSSMLKKGQFLSDKALSRVKSIEQMRDEFMAFIKSIKHGDATNNNIFKCMVHKTNDKDYLVLKYEPQMKRASKEAPSTSK